VTDKETNRGGEREEEKKATFTPKRRYVGK
jgi:hypothetical protein